MTEALTPSDGPARAEVRLTLVDDGGRWLDSAPSDIGVGAIKLWAWQVSPIVPRPADFVGNDCYLIKINYEMALEPEVPAPRWFEVGFKLSDPDGLGPIVVVDALPHTVLEQQPSTSYGLGSGLAFVAGTSVDLPSIAPLVDVFGIGGPHVRWRHASPQGARPGSYASWLAVAVPEGANKIEVRMTARFDMTPDDAMGFLPDTHGDSFLLSLSAPGSHTPLTDMVPSTIRRDQAPRVFVCYAHDDQPHIDAVRRFCEFLAACGIDTHVDRWDLDRRRDWYLWAIDQITNADFVIVVASPMCRAVGDGRIAADHNRGLQSELAVLREVLHDDRALWRARLLPVVLPNGDVADIPLFLQPRSADHYLVTDFTVADAEDLLRAITGQPAYRRPLVADAVVDLPHDPH